MSRKSDALAEVLERIDAAGVDSRYKHHSALVHIISDLEDAGEPVPHSIKQLSEEILAEVIEARFDNMPV